MKLKVWSLVLMISLSSSTSSNSQWLQSLTVIPSNPTTNDTIKVLANCMFPSGGCSNYTQNIQLNGNVIDAYALHCLGLLTVICNHTDTFVIPPMPAGNFTFRLTLEAGQGFSPCTPGFIPVQNDSINFTVSPITDIQEYISNDEVKIIPNPASDQIIIDGLRDEQYPLTIEVYSAEGKHAGSYELKTKSTAIDIRNLPTGIFQMKIIGTDKSTHLLPLVITK